MANLEKTVPIYDILDNGLVIGDNSAALSYIFKLKMPVVYTLDEVEFKGLVEDFRKFMELVGEECIFHKQDFFFSKKYNYNSGSTDFIEQSYSRHFNERKYYDVQSYLYISKISNSGNLAEGLISKAFTNTDYKEFYNTIINASAILHKYGVELNLMNKEDLLNNEISPFSKYFNLSDSKAEEIKDVDFSKGSIKVGLENVNLFTIENLGQFPTDDVTYCKEENGLPVSNLFNFSYKLNTPHILNQIIYIPNSNDVVKDLEKKQKQLDGFNTKGSNKAASEEIDILQSIKSEFNVNYAYYHTNIMTFGENEETIKKLVNISFAESGFKKKENILSRKDIYLGSFPTNAIRIKQQKENIMALMLDLQACSYLNYEQNYEDSASAVNGVKLCDRVYGIPISVDIFDKPKELGWIKNQNAIVLAGSGGGKSFAVNHITLNLFRQGAHFFCIDASFSYRLQCQMHNGVYLTYDDDNRISFNPIYLDWIDLEEAKYVFTVFDDKNEGDDDKREEIKSSNLYKNLLSDKINVIQGLLITLVKNEGELVEKFEESLIKMLIYKYYKDRFNEIMNANEGGEVIKQKMSFDDFYEYLKQELPIVLKEKGLLDEFPYKKFLYNLEPFLTGNELGYLLNSMDEKIKTIDQQRFVVIDVARIRSNKTLFSVVSILAMDLYNQKVSKLPKETKKILAIDEAWQAISSPEMATFMKTQVKVIRKYGGQTIFISQELDDFISSDIIKDSIINNSSIKIFADMGEFKNKFEPIKKVMAISDSNEKKIKSLNQNNRPDAKYKEICICWEHRGEVYGVEVPTELKAIYETDAEEVGKIMPNVEKYGVELTAINYANR